MFPETHLLLGGTGFIGRHVAEKLVSDNRNVIIVSRDLSKSARDIRLGSRTRYVRADLLSVDWDRLIDGVDVVHHYAWSSIPASANDDPLSDLSINLAITLKMLRAVQRRKYGRIIFSSSGGTVYGRIASVPINEDHPLFPITAYGAGKVTAEMYLGLYRALHGLDCRVARISNPYGSDQTSERGQGAITAFLRKAMQKSPLVIWGDGSVIRDYLHVSDAAAALVSLACADEVGDAGVFNVGSGIGVSLKEIVSSIERLLGEKVKVDYQPGRLFDVPVNVLDITRIKDRVGWAPRLSLEDGLKLTYQGLLIKSGA